MPEKECDCKVIDKRLPAPMIIVNVKALEEKK